MAVNHRRTDDSLPESDALRRTLQNMTRVFADDGENRDVQFTQNTPYAAADGSHIAVNPSPFDHLSVPQSERSATQAMRLLLNTTSHEVEHTTCSDLRGKGAFSRKYPGRPQLAGAVLNIVEDRYIDTRRTKRLRGLRRSQAYFADLLMSYVQTDVNDLLAENGKENAFINAFLQLSKGGYAKGFSQLPDDDSDAGQLREFLIRAEPMLETVEGMDSWDDRVELCHDFMALFREYLGKVDAPEPEQVPGLDMDASDVDTSNSGNEGNPYFDRDAKDDEEAEADEDADGQGAGDESDDEADDSAQGGAGDDGDESEGESTSDESGDADGDDSASGDGDADGDEGDESGGSGDADGDAEADGDEPGSGDGDYGAKDDSDTKIDGDETPDTDGAEERLTRRDESASSGDWWDAGDDDYHTPSESEERRTEKVQDEAEKENTELYRAKQNRDGRAGNYRSYDAWTTYEQKLGPSFEQAMRQIKTQERPTPSKRGKRVNVRGVVRRAAGDYSSDKLYMRSTPAESGGRNITVACDASGSMDATQLKVALIALSKACDAMGDRLGATFFRRNETGLITAHDEPTEDSHIDSFAVGGGTPIASGVRFAREIHDAAGQGSDDVLILLTDAQVTNTRYARRQVEAAHEDGLKVIGLGVGSVDADALAEICRAPDGTDASVTAGMNGMADALVRIYESQLETADEKRR